MKKRKKEENNKKNNNNIPFSPYDMLVTHVIYGKCACVHSR